MASAWVLPSDWSDEEIPDEVKLNREIRDQFNHVKYFPYAASALAIQSSTTATTFTQINTALNLIFTTYGGIIKLALVGNGSEAGGLAHFDIALNGTRISPSVSGAPVVQSGPLNVSFTRFITGQPSGVYTAQAQFRASPAGATAIATSGMRLWAMEVP